ncbi:hypothetical protein DAPPUDRAFT_316732 [Daphnia pulex]|uniref:Chitin-binding type-2 domain-containing protein n=1 Tax=Daphnia pulex TaxID=6669 RepID=E9GDU3_DAPPU|nr:hypothetical protein DAPPUDRAFT_316732 [Daphnia pulex]|eukprot:EFX82142.1 hypothetical protein DAPPUDRAFT_316732 [Daphnia pulex]
MKSAVGILRTELNEFKGTFNGSRNQNQDVFEISRRSTESLMRLAETKITVAGDLRKEVAAALQKFVETTAALTRELNETKATIVNLRKELTETKNSSMEITRRLAKMMSSEMIAGNESSERLPTFNCKGKADGNYGDPSSKCSSKFYICAHGNVFQRSCSAGTVYRANTLQCDWPRNVPGCEWI